jgi:hypothetical protein
MTEVQRCNLTSSTQSSSKYTNTGNSFNTGLMPKPETAIRFWERQYMKAGTSTFKVTKDREWSGHEQQN